MVDTLVSIMLLVIPVILSFIVTYILLFNLLSSLNKQFTYEYTNVYFATVFNTPPYSQKQFSNGFDLLRTGGLMYTDPNVLHFSGENITILSTRNDYYGVVDYGDLVAMTLLSQIFGYPYLEHRLGVGTAGIDIGLILTGFFPKLSIVNEDNVDLKLLACTIKVVETYNEEFDIDETQLLKLFDLSDTETSYFFSLYNTYSISDCLDEYPVFKIVNSPYSTFDPSGELSEAFVEKYTYPSPIMTLRNDTAYKTLFYGGILPTVVLDKFLPLNISEPITVFRQIGAGQVGGIQMKSLKVIPLKVKTESYVVSSQFVAYNPFMSEGSGISSPTYTVLLSIFTNNYVSMYQKYDSPVVVMYPYILMDLDNPTNLTLLIFFAETVPNWEDYTPEEVVVQYSIYDFKPVVVKTKVSRKPIGYVTINLDVTKSIPLSDPDEFLDIISKFDNTLRVKISIVYKYRYNNVEGFESLVTSTITRIW